MKDEATINTIRALRTRGELEAFAVRLADWLVSGSAGDSARDSASTAAGSPALTESRAKALLRASDLIDDATLTDFAGFLEQDVALRVTLYDLLQDTGLYKEDGVRGLVNQPIAGEPPRVKWLALITTAFAWRGGYPIEQLDPASPPNTNTPAGQLLRRAAQFVRRQVQRSATERDKLNRALSQPPSGAPMLEELDSDGQPIAPLPPHFRPPIPETYPEMSTETLQIDPQDAVAQPSITVGDPLVISADEVNSERVEANEPVRMPPITIERDQVAASSAAPPSPMPASAVVVPSTTSTAQSRPSLTVSLRQMFRQEELTTTKLRVIVQHYPDGPGLYGLQVRVSCKGIKSYVAGTTDRDGKFACELPVRAQSGLTYDVDVTWPREEGGETERKSITLHADRTHFVLPFYRRLDPPGDE